MKKNNSDSFSLYLKELEKFPLLQPEEEKELMEKALAGDKTAREKIITSNLKFVVKVASEYRNCDIEFEDLINAGNEGLLIAISKFDIEQDVKFITYASYWINHVICMTIHETGRCVKIPYNNWEAFKDIKFKSKSLNTLIENEDSEKIDMAANIIDDRILNPEDELIKNLTIEETAELVNILSPKERAVIVKRFGLEGVEPQTLQKIGTELGFTREYVRLIENQALIKMRNYAKKMKKF